MGGEVVAAAYGGCVFAFGGFVLVLGVVAFLGPAGDGAFGDGELLFGALPGGLGLAGHDEAPDPDVLRTSRPWQ